MLSETPGTPTRRKRSLLASLVASPRLSQIVKRLASAMSPVPAAAFAAGAWNPLPSTSTETLRWAIANSTEPTRNPARSTLAVPDTRKSVACSTVSVGMPAIESAVQSSFVAPTLARFSPKAKPC